ncbi:hypothetical protein C8R45DRAFT_1086843 [Mycena sanguinolenta]|nr:hypothetical protein C8R45DRAFT_1086843 [Mycena sanguinolenta]
MAALHGRVVAVFACSLLSSMWNRLRSVYHDILYTMHIDSLPPPSPIMSPTMAAAFFPITEYNRRDPINASVIRRIPFTVHTSDVLKRLMIASGDSCNNLRITKIQRFQRDVAPVHEYLVFSYTDCAPDVDSGTRATNFMVVERWELTPAERSRNEVEDHASLTHSPVEGLPKYTDLPPLFPIDSHKYLFRTLSNEAFIDSPPQNTNQRAIFMADDRISISWRRDPLHIALIQPGTSTLLATITPPDSSTVSVAEILALASFIAQHSDQESNCFYYTRAIFNVTRILMNCKKDNVVPTTEFDFMQDDVLP